MKTLIGIEQWSKERSVFLGEIVQPGLHLLTSIRREESVAAIGAVVVLSKKLKFLCKPLSSVQVK